MAAVLDVSAHNHRPAGRHVPAAATHTILGSLRAALAVAPHTGGATSALLAHTRPHRIHEWHKVALAAAPPVALGGVVLVIARMPSRVSREALDPKRDGALSKQPIDEFGP
jgi:uncharacterized transporter YbjL